jgi:acetyl-CoA carboxylase biotin carboxyl carrier protein
VSKNKTMDLKQIQELIRFVAKAGVSEVQLEREDFKIVIKTGHGEERPAQQVLYSAPMMQQSAQMQQMPQSAPLVPVASAEQPKAAEPVVESKTIAIKSPMIGTFYRKPGPDKDVFVQVGDKISAGDVVCVIEAMKLFNEIESDVSGTIVKILVDDSSPVEYDQPLFLVEPA